MSKVITVKMSEENEVTKPKLIKAAKKLKFKSVNQMLANSINNLIK
jgi:hypothetical protein